MTPNPLLPSILNQDGGDASNVTWPFLLLPRSFLLLWTDCSNAGSSSMPEGPWVSRLQAEAGCTFVQAHRVLITGCTSPSYFVIRISCLPGDHVPSGHFTSCCLQGPSQWVYKREMSHIPLFAKKKNRKKIVVQVESSHGSLLRGLNVWLSRCCGNSFSQ